MDVSIVHGLLTTPSCVLAVRFPISEITSSLLMPTESFINLAWFEAASSASVNSPSTLISLREFAWEQPKSSDAIQTTATNVRIDVLLFRSFAKYDRAESRVFVSASAIPHAADRSLQGGGRRCGWKH